MECAAVPIAYHRPEVVVPSAAEHTLRFLRQLAVVFRVASPTEHDGIGGTLAPQTRIIVVVDAEILRTAAYLALSLLPVFS